MNRLSLLLLTSLLAGTATISAAIPEPVRIDTGLITGTSTTTEDVRVFKGIPFAAPPVGDLRWRAPQPAAHWDGVRKADQFGPVCMQNRNPNATGPAPSEDCLYANVWTSAKAATERRPVIVWTYGGAFTGGSGSEPRYDGEALARKGAVVVTYNYRLGAFGFFAHPELTKESGHDASGNYGMMDMAAALHWVQRNIASFGGDPARVTIAGESAGAFLVSAMVGSPEGKGLFKRAISQSGAWMGIGIGKMTTRAQAEEAGVKLAQSMGSSSLAEMRAKPAGDLLKNGRGAGIVVDGWYVPEDLSATFAKGKENDADVLVGSNRDEGTFFARPGTNVSAAEFEARAKQRFGDLAAAYARLYPAGTDAEAAAAQLATTRDEMGWHMRTWALLQGKHSKDKSYLYYFTRVPPVAEGRPSRGATHTAELSYMFNNLLPGAPWTDIDKKLAETMSSYWVNFAATGNPNGKGLPEWHVYSEKAAQAMVLGDTVSVGTGIDPAILAFYDSYYRTFNGSGE
jgi:para-nitrobenzyl esterase